MFAYAQFPDGEDQSDIVGVLVPVHFFTVKHKSTNTKLCLLKHDSFGIDSLWLWDHSVLISLLPHPSPTHFLFYFCHILGFEITDHKFALQ